ncbi:hypothetical protein QFC19_006731 [Naganishia cerealis]|uniref:Uncharacterized protein n=1 Tax=Naganishia cerealis TaxID=610337 RepID=A0ACC2VF42_9TREE|nr:hypothetical protein QFC19_006731 [Naganishia cerealis]
MTGRYLPSVKYLNLTQTQTATQSLSLPCSVEATGSAENMQVDTQESAATNDEDDEKTPTKAQLRLDESKPEIGMKGGTEGWPLRDENIVARGMLLVGGLEEMEGYNDSESYGTIKGSFEMAKAETNGKPNKTLATSAKQPIAKPAVTAFAKPAAATKSATSTAQTSKVKPAGKATKKLDDEEPMLKPGKLSARNSKRVIRSESPEEEEEPVERNTAAGKQKEVQVSMPTNKSAKPLKDLDIAEEDRLAMEAMMDMSDNFDMPSSNAVAQPMEQDQGEEGENVSPEHEQDAQVGKEGKVLKKRRISKSVEKKNKRGFTYYEDVSTDEEYWSDGNTATESRGKNPVAKANPLKRNASTTSASTKGDDGDSQSESQGMGAGKKAAVGKTKAGAAVTSGLKSGGTGKTSAAGGKPAPKKAVAGQQSMFSYFKKQ